MIVNVGTDIVKVERIKNILERYDEKFLNRIFTKEEMEYTRYKNKSFTTVSGMFAGKEAVLKVLGIGMGKISWKDIEIIHDKKGKPSVRLRGKGYSIFSGKTIDNIHISISHEKDYAIAYAVGERNSCGDEIVVDENMISILPKRKKDSYKGNYGRVGVIGGSLKYTGAPFLCGKSSLKAGSGLVYSIVPKSIRDILSVKFTEEIVISVEDDKKGFFNLSSMDEILNQISEMDALALGPGIARDEETKEVVFEVLKNFKGPIVLDADGLYFLSFDLDVLYERKGPTVITPHMGEFSRLIKLSPEDIKLNKIKYSKNFSAKYNVITVLKGVNTIVASPQGNVYVNRTGNPGMATAGSGDVLTGIILSLLGQGIDEFHSSMLGVYVHGLSGDLAKLSKGEYGMTAGDIMNSIPSILNIMEKRLG